MFSFRCNFRLISRLKKKKNCIEIKHVNKTVVNEQVLTHKINRL